MSSKRIEGKKNQIGIGTRAADSVTLERKALESGGGESLDEVGEIVGDPELKEVRLRDLRRRGGRECGGEGELRELRRNGDDVGGRRDGGLDLVGLLERGGLEKIGLLGGLGGQFTGSLGGLGDKVGDLDGVPQTLRFLRCFLGETLGSLPEILHCCRSSSFSLLDLFLVSFLGWFLTLLVQFWTWL